MLISCKENISFYTPKVSEEIQRDFPDEVKYHKAETLTNYTISTKPKKQYEISDGVQFSHWGDINFTGRVFDHKMVTLYDQKVLKLYIVYGKRDSSDFILKNSTIKTVNSREFVFPYRIIQPRFIKNIVLTIFQPNEELLTLERGDYISINSMWGSVDSTKSSKHSDFGLNNYLLFNTKHSITRSVTKIPYEKTVFIKDKNGRKLYTEKELSKSRECLLQLPDNINKSTPVAICLENKKKEIRQVITFNNCMPSELISLKLVHPFGKNSWLVINTKNGEYKWQLDFFSRTISLTSQSTYKENDHLMTFNKFKMSNTPYHYNRTEENDDYHLLYKVMDK